MPFKFKTLALAAIAFFGSPLLAQASDISIYAPTFSLIDATNPAAGVIGMTQVDVWSRIRKGFSIPDLDSAQVASQTEFYSSRPDFFERTTLRASPYLFHVVQELEKRGMPTELALLPFIESSFNPQAFSSAKAVGLWQFMPATGRDFNLKQDMFKDDRRDVLASTDAALTYLQTLFGMFGDWQLALAAYNWGQGSVQKAIDKNQAAGLPTDFASLAPLMPLETRNYVPKLQAVKNIIAAPEAYNIALPKIDNEPYFVTIGKTRDIDVKVAAQLAELSLDDFKALNPQFNRPVIVGSADTKILLPQSNAEKFKKNIAKWTHSLSSWTSHTVGSARERIEAIAARFDTTPAILREVNHIPPRMVLTAGSTILVPKTDTDFGDITAAVADNATMSVAPDTPETRRIFVKVGNRDTLASIARRYNVSAMQVKSWNNLRHDTVSRGQSLQLNIANRAGGNGHTIQRASGGTQYHKAVLVNRHGQRQERIVKVSGPVKKNINTQRSTAVASKKASAAEARTELIASNRSNGRQ
ncbi:transglycosylase SLT domain-containing protein [Glaciimonas immobilis]|uniref:Membrane-bound lytic murein transglycosylase D n=1 Tax=Glaciimonas immobilis TaxID=728004 RepID=A0A840RS53_9BURK|nr:transglycosylase SLT domain-containing protein [Glaciimonas immobilis]KAF3998011.1 transglycosylase SLT domain-containing protein [Glaciimonas immobilis]MBB5199309.1 membrane-bound lytic murein transglycosylase D [Glaciimonas immobilis]